ncbi:MAG: PD-(D/E)XK nuclease family protein [Muribaculaceae bacterium]|nr:PD-(D/E)XK nuclease family protein [Muribaculaceae bacterium]
MENVQTSNSLQTPNKGKGIVLNRMYVGTYLFSNLGHEVINFYTADNGNHYIYLNSAGDFAKEHKGKMGYMIFTKYISPDCAQVLGIATGLKDIFDPETQQGNKKEIKEPNEQQRKLIEGIKYGGVDLYKIFNESERQNVYVTYRAEAVYKLNSEYYIYFKKDESGKQNECNLKHHNQASTSLKQYIKGDDSEDYKRLLAFINTIIDDTENCIKLNENHKVKLSSEEIPVKQDSIFDICKIQNSETAFSNALKYFMEHQKYKVLFQAFFANHNVCLGEDYSIEREEETKIDYKNLSEECKRKLIKVKHKDGNEEYPSGGRIDLLIRTKDSVIVIENKIKSDINKKESDNEDTTQLERYYNYANWLITEKEKNDERSKAYFIILAPNYNKTTMREEMNDIYQTIKYKELYDFLSLNKTIFENDTNFMAFYEAMKRHTYDNVNDYLYYEMQDKFYNRINQIITTKTKY